MQQPEQLNIQCTLGALYLPKTGSLRGLAARYRMPDNDVNNTFNLEFKKNLDSAFSPNLQVLKKGSGGTLPKLNLKVGAPMATFAEGSILPNKIAYPYTGIQAAQKSNFNNSYYDLPKNTTVVDYNQYEGIENKINESSVDSFLQNATFGYIPLRKNEITGDQSVKNTWNIWTQLDGDPLKKKFIGGLGCVNYQELGLPHIATTIGSEIPGISVNAINNVCRIERIFPLADDLVYDSPTMYFRNVANNTMLTKQVKAKGGPNCGFRLSFTNVSPFGAFLSNGSYDASAIAIAFGDFNNSGPKNKISYFSLTVMQGSIYLSYYNPVTRKNENQQINKTGFAGGGDFDFYVHFAGPNMYFGFSPDVSTWEVFEPITVGSGDNSKVEPFITSNAKIRVLFQNLNCNFHYSPICFDTHDSNNTNSRFYGKSTISSIFEINNDDQTALNSLSENSLNNDFFKRMFAYGTNNFNSRNIQEMPTFYADCRAMNTGNRNEIKSVAEYQADPEFQIYNLGYQINNQSEDIRRKQQSVIAYETTIEGPVFHYCRNFLDDGASTPSIDNTNTASVASISSVLDYNTQKIVKSIWGKYSDITKYFVSATINESYENKNKSYKNVTANIELANMTNDNIGRQILNVMQENLLVITLKAGYDSEGYHTYFQGIIKNVTVKRSSDKFTISLTCGDLGNYLLENSIFNIASPVPLSFRPYGYLLRDVFNLLGLSKYYKPRERFAGYDPLWDRMFNYVEGTPRYMTSVNNKITSITMKQKPKEVITRIFENMIFRKNLASGILSANEFPVIRWDPNFEVYTVGLRGDEIPEELWLAGPVHTSSDSQPLLTPNGSIHGIVVGGELGWTESTNLDTLHTEVWLESRLFDDRIFPVRSSRAFINSGVSLEAFNKLNSLVREGNIIQDKLGYVGFNKIKYEDLVDDPIMKTESVVLDKLNGLEYLVRNTRQELNFSCYVTKPLRSYAKFKIKSFADSGFLDFSDEYVFKKVDYSIDVNNNLITAKVEGENLPEGN